MWLILQALVFVLIWLIVPGALIAFDHWRKARRERRRG